MIKSRYRMEIRYRLFELFGDKGRKVNPQNWK